MMSAPGEAGSDARSDPTPSIGPPGSAFACSPRSKSRGGGIHDVRRKDDCKDTRDGEDCCHIGGQDIVRTRYRGDSFVRLDAIGSTLLSRVGQSRGDTITPSIRPASPARCEKNRSLLQREQYSLIEM